MNKRSISFEEFLSELEIDEDSYIKTIHTSLNGTKIFLKRTLDEIRIKAHMKEIVQAWKGNHDIQFVLGAYACDIYIVSYIRKLQ